MSDEEFGLSFAIDEGVEVPWRLLPKENEGIMSKHLNVVDLGAFKELKELRKTVSCFEKYLKGLTNGQLETEVNFLLDDFSNDQYGIDFFSKSQLILKEIAYRAHPAVKSRIDLLRTEV